ncbi:MAG: ribonuclease HII [Candidatus Altiarchaeota archaeon]|nr:ribonuclease HII [Candidatus Altiarchaeota archaeon]
MKVLGIDEAGRGPVIGPMVMGGFMIDDDRIPELKLMGVKDSKLLTPERREELAEKLQKMGDVFIRVIEPHQIDGFNLNRLEKIATRDIILEASPDKVIIDAFEKNLEAKLALKTGHGFNGKVIAEHKADLKYEVVGAASIVAKVLRDKEIKALQGTYGDFGSGYPSDPKTAEFVKNIIKSKQALPSFIRKSWDTVRRVLENESQVKLSGFLEK